MTKIIAFSGKKQSGKNTSANFLYSFFLVNSGLFKSIIITPQGTIEGTKQSEDTPHEIDINKFRSILINGLVQWLIVVSSNRPIKILNCNKI